MVKTIQSLSIYQSSKIDVVKSDGTDNFDLWRYGVLDVLNMQNLEDTLELHVKPEAMRKLGRRWIKHVASLGLVWHKI